MADEITPAPETAQPEATPAETPAPPQAGPSAEEIATLKAQAEAGTRAASEMSQYRANFQRLAAQDPKIATVLDAAIRGLPYAHLLESKLTETPVDPLADAGPLTAEQIRAIVQEETRKQASSLSYRLDDIASEVGFTRLVRDYGEDEVKKTAPLLDSFLSVDPSRAKKLGPEWTFKITHHDVLAAENARLKAELEKVRVKKAASVGGAPSGLGDRIPTPPDILKDPKKVFEFHFRKSALGAPKE